MPNCPVCNTTLTTYSYYDHDIHWEVERTESCPYCDYSFEYMYGCSGICFYGDYPKTFSWCWSTPDTEVERITTTDTMVAHRMKELLP